MVKNTWALEINLSDLCTFGYKSSLRPGQKNVWASEGWAQDLLKPRERKRNGNAYAQRLSTLRVGPDQTRLGTKIGYYVYASVVWLLQDSYDPPGIEYAKTSDIRGGKDIL